MTLSSRQIYLQLLQYVVPYWRTFLLSIVAMIVLAITEPTIPALLKPMLDGSFVDKNLSTVNLIAGLLVVLFVIRGLAGYVSQVALAWVANKLVMDLRSLMFDKLITLPAGYHDNNPSGTLISKFTFDVTQVTEAATHVLTVLIRDSLAIAGLLAWMLYLNWKLTLIALMTAPLIVFIVQKISVRLRSMSVHIQQSMGEITHILEEVIDGHKVMKVFGAQEYERERFTRSADRNRRYLQKFASASATSAPLAQLIVALAFAAIIYLSARQSAAGEITVGGFVSFFAAMGMLFAPLKRLTSVNAPLQKGIAAAQSAFQLVAESSEVDKGTRVLDHPVRGQLVFKNVSFSYPGKEKPALNDISLVFQEGETVALVGPSGSGKTTLINLIPRFHAPTSGQIFFDGIETSTLRLTSLRSHIALVSQDIVLFNDTIAANIAYGRRGVRESAIVDAAIAAHAMEFIQDLPEGLDTLIGEEGVRLSGGQRQRLAIARAFLKNAPLLILDEATSSLDASSERHIQDALEHLQRGRTTIVIAHRLSTIERSDRIVVMAGGCIQGMGTHAALLESNSLYAGLYRFQFARQGARLTVAGTN
jgi:subfamily B ATP-binding cassette protein MsbA